MPFNLPINFAAGSCCSSIFKGMLEKTMTDEQKTHIITTVQQISNMRYKLFSCAIAQAAK